MRIYRRAEFLKLPAGTVFAKGQQWCFDSLSVKGDTTHNDFYVHNLQWIESSGSDQDVERLEEMLQHGSSYPMEDAEVRDGCFDDNDFFLVYEVADLQNLMEILQRAMKCEVCGWSLAKSADEGCVAGNCSYRPPEGTGEYRRIQQRREALKKRSGS